jgi:hypothetical protein
MRFRRTKFLRTSIALSAVIGGLLFAPQAKALSTFREIPSTVWGYTYAGGVSKNIAPARTSEAHIGGNTVFNVTYTNFPEWAKKDVQAAIDIWASNFPSSVPISVDATWNRSSFGILGSASPVNFFEGFAGAPDSTLWYPSALANALAGKDLDPNHPEILIQANSNANWDQRNDGQPTTSEYDLESVFIHEIGHGLGFLSTDVYDNFSRYGLLDQPTIFDAYLQTPDGHRVSDIQSPSLELGQALTHTLVWSGPLGIQANNGVKPLLYTPARYESGSSVSHLDEATFSSSGLDSVMTPNLDAGEVFHQPGPLLKAMLDDLRNKPPVGAVTSVSQPPLNSAALVSDKSALITFDPPADARISQVLDYSIKNNVTNEITTASASPVLITGLKNGTPYDFSVTARNILGESSPAITNSVSPQTGWINTSLDKGADGKHLATTIFKNQPAVVYTDSISGDLKLALWTGKTWQRIVLDGRGGSSGRTNDNVSGPVSACVSGARANQILHVFYTDLDTKDLHYLNYNSKKFNYAIVDGNGPTIQKYDEPVRVRTASDVSISNACAATAAGIQVFYRDESQGVLLGASKSTGGKWSYELIDGDRKTENRTTGDVGMKLKAVAVGSKVTILYSSVLAVDTQRLATSGEMRLASRSGLSTDWTYQSLDSPSNSMAVAGYDISLNKTGSGVIASWLTATRLSLQNPNQIHWVNADLPNSTNVLSTSPFGSPSGPLSVNDNALLFGCEDRLCAMDLNSSSGNSAIKLVSDSRATQSFEGDWITVNKVRYAVASIAGKLALLRP